MTDLSRQPPPRRGAKPGYYPDPLGSNRGRWWDGSAWTTRIGPPLGSDAPRGKPVEPPKKLCRHCGTQSESFGQSCPNCGRSYGSSPWLIAAAVAAACVTVLAGLGGCAVLAGLALEEAQEEIEEDAITRSQYESVEVGDREAEVRARLGDPLGEESFSHPDLECLYYAQKDEGFSGIDDYRLCFRDGLLHSKSRE